MFYEGNAYLEISGVANRLPFKFFGRGLGPKFKFGFDVLDVGSVTLGGSHTYEIPVQNISDINGLLRCEGLIGIPSGMGLKVEPKELQISPSQYTAFYVNFSCIGQPGQFEDVIKFSVMDSDDIFYVSIK